MSRMLNLTLIYGATRISVHICIMRRSKFYSRFISPHLLPVRNAASQGSKCTLRSSSFWYIAQGRIHRSLDRLILIPFTRSVNSTVHFLKITGRRLIHRSSFNNFGAIQSVRNDHFCLAPPGPRPVWSVFLDSQLPS
jgi:hypothetical protein